MIVVWEEDSGEDRGDVNEGVGLLHLPLSAVVRMERTCGDTDTKCAGDCGRDATVSGGGVGCGKGGAL